MGDCMNVYIVRPGDSLQSVAAKFGADAKELALINQLSDKERLTAGQALIVAGENRHFEKIEVNAHVLPNVSICRLRKNLPVFTYLCPFAWNIDMQGGLIPIEDRAIINEAYDTGTVPVLCVSNVNAGAYSGDIVHAVLSSESAENHLIDNIFSAMRQRGYRGLNISMAYIHPCDRAPFGRFIERLSNLLHEKAYSFSCMAAPKCSDTENDPLSGAYDYALMGRCCDRVILMTYEWGYTYSPPMAVSPVNKIRPVLEYALSRMPGSKILLGMSDYGYDWSLPWTQGREAKLISSSAAQSLAVSAGAHIAYDEAAAAPYFRYKDPAGIRHELHFEDARSIIARMGLVKEYGLAGISCWTADYIFGQMRELLRSDYSIEKRI